jgi:hypothetical protein
MKDYPMAANVKKVTYSLKIWENFVSSGPVTGAGIAQYNDGLDDRVSITGRRNRFFSKSTATDRLWGPSSLQYNGYWGLFLWG